MRICLLILLMLVVAGCERRLSVISSPIQIDVARTADPSPVEMQPVTIRVITRENLETFVAELRQQQGDQPVFIAIGSRDYENLLLNLADLRRYIEQQQSIIIYYRQMTSPRSSSN